MRKIDALLLSALVLYDYSAQSLADNSFSAATDKKNYSVDSLYLADEYSGLLEKPENIHYLDLPEIVITAPAKAESVHYVDLPEIVITARSKDSRYLDLPEVVITASKKKKADINNSRMVTIGMPDRNEEVLVMPFDEEPMPEVAMALQIEKVAVGRLAKDLQFVDSDGDGVYDYEDKCISIPGVARFEGCPVPDSDGDGINDEEDKCPFEAGVNENGGCPVQVGSEHVTHEVFNSTDWMKKIPDSESD